MKRLRQARRSCSGLLLAGAVLLQVTLLSAQPIPIAIVEFEGNGISQTEAIALTDRLHNELFRLGAFEVVERGMMETILNEQQPPGPVELTQPPVNQTGDLQPKAVKPEVAYTSEFLWAMGDTVDSNLFLDNLDVVLDFDTEALGLWRGGTLHLYFLSNQGDNPSELIGDIQVTSNIEADDSQRLYEFWYNQALGNFEILLGLHDLNSEFYTSDVAGLFCNSSFGIGADVAGNIPVSIFNVAGLGVRLLYTPNDNVSILAAFYDGDPGDVERNPHGLTIDWEKDEGVMSIFEAQVAGGGPENKEFSNTYRLGVWYHSGLFDVFGYDSQGNPLEPVHGNFGTYFTADRWLTRTMAGFAHGGVAASDRSWVPFYFGAGMNYSPRRIKDTFGLAFAAANVPENEGGWEVALEFTWQKSIKGFLVIQPDIQYVILPGGWADRGNRLIAGVRISVVL